MYDYIWCYRVCSGETWTQRGKITSNHLLQNSWPLHVHLFKELERDL